MKLGKDYFSDSKNAKHLAKGPLYTLLFKHCKDLLGGNITDGKHFVIDSDLDGRWFMKVDREVKDFEKVAPNVWISRFSRILKVNNPADRTVYMVYKDQK
jgi:hypothetical protein